jgi:methylmalonyl-CoA mutase
MYFNVAVDYMVAEYCREHQAEVDNSALPRPALPQDLAAGPTAIHPEYRLPLGTVKKIRDCTFKILRGTVQADILKEIQAQNECVFQEDFAVKLMGDVQEFFIRNGIQKFYSISISGYHIGEAGATPVQELSFVLSNGLTYLENFLGRGMAINDVAPNFSFFLRNSHELEWLAAGPVCRKIWAIAIKEIYRGDPRSQMFKFHTQTSGRALQIPEWDTLNPPRQTLHALVGLLNNTNSLHVDSADEPITTPSEKYVRQSTMIPNFLTFEAEIMKAENLLSGSHSHRAIRASLQEAILAEMERIDAEGGVGPATEVGYHRNLIATESCKYEFDIATGKRPIIGRNVCVAEAGKAATAKVSLTRPSEEDWQKQIARIQAFKGRNQAVLAPWLAQLKAVASQGGNVFEELINTTRYATLGQITTLLKQVGGSFRQMI